MASAPSRGVDAVHGSCQADSGRFVASARDWNIE
jgi:hypothetical protein